MRMIDALDISDKEKQEYKKFIDNNLNIADMEYHLCKILSCKKSLKTLKNIAELFKD